MIGLNPFARFPYLSAIARRHLWTVPLVAVLGLINGVLEGIGIGLLIPMLGTLLGRTGVSEGLLSVLDTFGQGLDASHRLILIILTMLGLIALKIIFQASSRLFVARIDGQAGHEIREALSERLLRVGYPFHLATDPAHLVNIVATESWHACEAIRAAFARVSSAATAVIFGIFLVAIDWRLTIAVVAGALVIRAAQAGFIRRLRQLSERVSQTNELLADRMLVSVYQGRIIRLFGQEAAEQHKFSNASDEVRRSHFHVERLSSVIASILEMLHVALFAGVLLLAIRMEVAIPELAAFLVLLNRLQPHLRSVEEATAALASSTSQVRAVEWLLDPADKPAPPQGKIDFRDLKTGIEFRNVGFRYPTRPDAVPALAGVNFTIAAGGSTALIGRSGSGKSTVIHLLCRLLEPTEGQIVVDGTALSMLDPNQWLRAIGIAGQDIDLVDGTLADNIRYGLPELSQTAIEAAARFADADAFIKALPEGYETRVGSRGLNLSGGQRQRIGLARALAREPSLLILDEATNAVDGLSEAAILNLLRHVPRRMTLVVISHRASALALCDDGVVLDHGNVIESGPLSALATYQTMLAIEDTQRQPA